jgi:hypothetical protein
MNNEQFLANKSPSKKEVHDLDKETTNCQVDAIIKAGHAKGYWTLAAAKADGYDNCAYCLGGSTR